MITEDYVSFEVAKLLKEKGFDEECKRRYDCRGELSRVDSMVYMNSHRDMQDKYVAPTLQMAMKWLREVHSINFNISWNPTFKDYFVEIFKPTLLYSTITYQNYEEACEVAIRYCLENLVNKKESNH